MAKTDFNDARRSSIKEGLNIETEPENEEKNEVVEENDGNGSDDSYLEKEENTEAPEGEQELGNTNSVLQKTFDGDVDKLEKSYLEAQKSAGQKAQELKQLKGELDNLKNTQQVLDNNPTLKNLYEKAKQGEDVESLVANRRSEPDEGESNNSPSNDGKFDGIEDEFLPTKDKLIDLGYLDEQVDSLNDFDKKSSVLNAQQAYLSQNLPKMLEDNVRKARQKVRKEEEEEHVQQTLTNTNDARLQEGFDKAITNYGLDFAGDHNGMFDEIMNEVGSFRDSEDGRLIRENAVELATEEVLRRKGMDINANDNTTETPSKSSDEAKQENFNTKRSSSKATPQKSDQDLTLEERMSKRRAENAQSTFDRRRGLYKSRN